MSKPPRKPPGKSGSRAGGGSRDQRGGRDSRGRNERPSRSERPQRSERKFGERSERPAGPRSESKFSPRSERPFAPRGERKFGERPQGQREFSRDDRDRFGKPPRAGGRDERAPRGDRPYQGDRPQRSAAPARSEKPYRSDRPQRDFAPRGERPQRSERPERSERPQRFERSERGPRSDVAVQPWRGKPDARSGGGAERGERSGDRPAFRPRKPFGKNWRKPTRDPDGPVLLYGWHSVKAALENPARKFHKLLVTENALHRLQDDGIDLPIDPDLVEASEIDAELGPDAVHQGILAEADPLPALDISEVPAQGITLVLDQVTDPHNVGAILRTAVAFGVTAIVTTQRHSPDMTGVLAKAASGALELVPIVFVPNLARAIEALKDNNVFVVGLDSEGDGDISSVPLRAPLALVVGAEGKGLRQLTRATCDAVARLDLPGKIKSLNVSNATALALYVATSRVASG